MTIMSDMQAEEKAEKMAEKRLLLASPRGYCAGVDRAVNAVEKALDLYGAPVYVRKEIVHNRQLRDLGYRQYDLDAFIHFAHEQV